MYPRSLARINWYSTSEDEPVAMTRNLRKSGLVLRPHPSAILVGMDELDRLIWEVRPNISSLGNDDFVNW